jgi:alkylation response protein AidB-like acyl-CoA dehydrogenase
MAHHADSRADPAHWAQLDQGSVELVRRARGADARVECSMSKYFCSEAANQVATRAVQVFGAAGLMEGNVAERLFRDAREATIGEGTSQMQVLQIGKALLGVSAVR